MREKLSVEELWELPLERYGHGSPQPPEKVVAECSPKERCRALAIPAEKKAHREMPAMRLVVVALEAGAVDVKVRTKEPDSDEWKTLLVFLEFTPTPAQPTLTLGMGRPKGVFKLAHITDALQAYNINGPARCEVEDDFAESHVCFGPELVADVQRYPSCAHTRRCVNDDLHWGRFQLSLDRRFNDGGIFRMTISGYADAAHQQLDVWE